MSVQWPHIPPQNAGDTVVYDILRMQPSASLAANAPSFPIKGSCTGGSVTACGSVGVNEAQCSGLVCTYTDAAGANTAELYDSSAELGTGVAVLAGERGVFGRWDRHLTTIQWLRSIPSRADVVSVDWNALPTLQVRDCGDTAAIGVVVWRSVGAVPGRESNRKLRADWRAAVSGRKL